MSRFLSGGLLDVECDLSLSFARMSSFFFIARLVLEAPDSQSLKICYSMMFHRSQIGDKTMSFPKVLQCIFWVQGNVGDIKS